MNIRPVSQDKQKELADIFSAISLQMPEPLTLVFENKQKPQQDSEGK